MIRKNKIVVTGGSGRFAQSLKNVKCKYKFIYPNKNHLNITSIKSIKKFLKKNRPQSVLHLAGLSRPMIEHEKNINKSINLNIVGTSNIVQACSELNIKIIYLSTHYVYPGTKGNYKESSPLFPWNNYAWSKLGGECAVQMYKNSLILRVCMTEKPFLHKKAFADVKLNFIFHEDLVEMMIKLLDKKGIINLGGPSQTVYNFAKKYNKKIKRKYMRKGTKNILPPDSSMNLSKLRKILKKYN